MKNKPGRPKSSHPRSVPCTGLCDQELADAADRQAMRENTSRSQIVERAMKQYLSSYSQQTDWKQR